MSWNYRVVRKVWEINGEKEEQFGIHEVYYRNGEPSMVSVDPDASGGTLEELKQDLALQLKALEKPTLDYEDIGDEITNA